MSLKDLIEKRKDVLFAEIGALIHDLGKLSKEFIQQTTEGSIFDHSLILGRDFRNNLIERYGKNNDELDRIIQRINNLKNELSAKKIYEILNEEIGEFLEGLSKKQKKKRFDSFLILLRSKFSSENFNKLHFLENFIFTINNELVTFGDIISKHHIQNMNQQILKIFKSSDGVDSGIDKMVAENASYPKQSKDHTYISTAFGCEKEKIDLNADDSNENYLTKIRTDYANKLASILDELKDEDFSSNENKNVKTWINKREELLKETRNAFLKALGETRRPSNDVTLWDHSYSVASLYKSALAEVVINQWKDPKEIKWKLLSIRFDADEFYHSINKIADVLGRKSLVEKIFENIKILLEVIIPIGNEIYRDENGSIFLVSESVDDSNILTIDDVWDKIKEFKIESKLNFKGEWEKKELEKIIIHSKPTNIKQLIEAISSFISQGIFVPEIQVSEPSRGALNIGKVIAEKKRQKIDVNYLQTKKWNGKQEGYLKCSVCGLRPIPLTKEEKENLDEKVKTSGWRSLSEEEKNQYKAFERKVCEDCLKSAFDRVKEWKNNPEWNESEPEKPSFDTSIWLDEISDENNRIALVYLSFDLEKWLNGEMLNTFLSKPLLDDEFKTSFENELENISNYNQLVELIKEAFDKNDFNKDLSVNKKDENKLKTQELFSKVLGCFIQKDQKPLDIFSEVVTQREPDWQDKYECPSCATKGDNYHKAVVFLLHLTRKHPSFARLRRIWETTKNFGIEIFKKTMEILNKKERPIITFNPNNILQITHTYYFKDENETRFELVITNDNEAAVILNADKFKVPENGEIKLYDENFNNVIATLENVRLSEQKEFYYPLIPYQFEPTRTLFFMPLKYVWEIIEKIKEQYEMQFNKVQNRLPIKLGFVAFNKNMPMYVVLEAARKMYSKDIKDIKNIEDIKEKELKICQINEMSSEKNYRIYGGKIGNYGKEIKMSDGNEYHFSYSTGDPNKKDLFHPYFIVIKNGNNHDDTLWKVYFNRNSDNKHRQNPNDNWLPIKHVKDLRKGDKVLFYPSQFDFLWLDSNIRRFDVGKKRRHWLFKKCSPKPYNLKDIEKFKRLKDLLFNQLSLTTSQIMNLYGLLISKMQEWKLDEQKWKLDEVEELRINEPAFEQFVENSILSIPLRLKISDVTEKGKITQQDFEFFKKSILNGIFFDLIDMWHTILKRKFKEEDNINE